MRHANNGDCPKCKEIMDRYHGLHAGLKLWFKALQRTHPEAHVACAGRGEADQEALFHRRATRAQFGQSAHNYNAALDLFENAGDKTNIYEIDWFKNILAPNIPEWLEWYGKPGSKFYELPHVELKGWRKAVETGELKLIIGT